MKGILVRDTIINLPHLCSVVAELAATEPTDYHIKL